MAPRRRRRGDAAATSAGLSERLLIAAKTGDINAATRCLARGADVNCMIENGRTPLFLACQFGHVDVARLCLEHGVAVGIGLVKKRLHQLLTRAGGGEEADDKHGAG